MNWGFRIVIGMAAFIIFIMTSVIYMVTKDTDSLEDIDYYENSLNFDREYDRKLNLRRDDVRPRLRVENDTLYIYFISSPNKGNLKFKRLSDGALDLILPFETFGNDFQLPISSFQSGYWELQIFWESRGRSYLFDHGLNFPM